MKKVVLLLALLSVSGCTDRYRNPADDPANQPSTTYSITETGSTSVSETPLP